MTQSIGYLKYNVIALILILYITEYFYYR